MKLAWLAMLWSAPQLNFSSYFWIIEIQSANTTDRRGVQVKWKKKTIRSPLMVISHIAGENISVEFSVPGAIMLSD